MGNALRLMCILAHPDDESLGMGGTLARYASEGVETYLVTATRGERGRYGDLAEAPTPEEVGRIREAELLAAARELGLKEVMFLDYIDRELDKADTREALEKIAGHLRRVRPQVVITFGPEGGYGHPDHIAISQLATAGIVCAADVGYQIPVNPAAPHRVSKLYYMAWGAKKMEAYQAAFRTITVRVDGHERQASPWPDWAITTVIETGAHWPAVWRAVCCHQTQLAIYKQLEKLSEEHHRFLWGSQQYYRAFSTVNGGRELETDLFAGLRG
jgi:LmbE family N-acetylglucosaminyl deacetylase